MQKFYGMINVGYGDMHYVFEAKDQKDADEIIYEIWLEEASNNCDRTAVPYVAEQHDEYEPEEI